MRYPSPCGWISVGGEGKTMFMTVTDADGLAVRWGRVRVGGNRECNTGRGRAETTWVGLNISPLFRIVFN
jgi:hypothetical protein